MAMPAPPDLSTLSFRQSLFESKRKLGSKKGCPCSTLFPGANAILDETDTGHVVYAPNGD